MPLPIGFESVVNDQVPRHPGLRWLNAKTLAIHPEVYAQFEKLFKDPGPLRELLAVMPNGMKAFGQVMEQTGAAFKAFVDALIKCSPPPAEGEEQP